MEVQDGSGALVASPTQIIAGAFLWAYSYVNQGQLAMACILLNDAYQGQSLQSLGIDLVTGLQWGDDVLNIAADLKGITLGPEDPAAIASAFSLVGDILTGWSALQADTNVKDPKAVVSQLETLGLISVSSGTNYSATEVFSNLAKLANLAGTSSSQLLDTIITSLYSSAYGTSMSPTASFYAQNFLAQLVPNAEQALLPSALESGYDFVLAYGLAEFPLNDAIYSAGVDFAQGAVIGLVKAAADEVIQNFLVPLKDLLQAESSLESAGNNICTGTTATFAPIQSGGANIDAAGAYAATGAFAYGVLASWFSYDAQLMKGEESGAYTYAQIVNFLDPLGIVPNPFQLSAQQEAANETFDIGSVPNMEYWVQNASAFFQASSSAATTITTAAGCGVPGSAIISLSNHNVVFPVPVAVGVSAVQTVTLTNMGTVTLSITGMPQGGSNPGDFQVSNNCGASVPAGTDCTIKITFAPTAVGARVAGVNVVGNASNSPQNIAVSGVGAPPGGGVPSITSLTPSSAVAGGPAFTLMVAGSNFVMGSVVYWNVTALVTSYTSATQLSASVPASLIVNAGIFSVVVTRPSRGGSSSPANFAVQGSINPLPTVTSLSPSSASAGSSPLTLTINGSGFIASSSVTFNGLPHTATFVSASQLTITLSSSDLAKAGTFAVVVTNPSPGGGSSNAVSFTVQATTNPLPSVTSLSPSSASAGSISLTLTINGSGFIASSSVTFNGLPHAATFVSASQLSITLSSSDLANAGTFAVVVTNPSPGGGNSQPLNFTVTSVSNSGVPTLLTPTNGDILPAGTTSTNLTWSAVNGASYYIVLMWGGGTSVLSFPPAATSLGVSVASGQQYYWQVGACTSPSGCGFTGSPCGPGGGGVTLTGGTGGFSSCSKFSVAALGK